jgi:hypothetical protein
MTFTLSVGWWLVPAIITIALLVGWRLFGVRMQPNRGSMFPDAGGALMELCGYLVATLLAVIAWLIWAVLT